MILDFFVSLNFLKYSLAYLVVPNTEDQFSQPFLDLQKIRQVFQDPIII